MPSKEPAANLVELDLSDAGILCSGLRSHRACSCEPLHRPGFEPQV